MATSAPFADALETLHARIDGDLRLDPTHRRLYAADASLYAQEPLGVVYPKHREDIVAIVSHAHTHGIPLIPRGAGTSLAGQCVGSGLVVDISRHMTHIGELDAEAGTVRVEPGVILDQLNRHLAPDGLFFGPDTSTSDRCNIGGMLGNNSCGSHSILYGNTLANVVAAEVVLADGSIAHLGERETEAIGKGDGAETSIEQGLLELVGANRDAILERYPKPEVTRRNMGYALDFLARSAAFEDNGEPWNLAKFLCGSEGTLGIVTEATLKLVPLAAHKMIVAVHFDTLRQSLEATVASIAHDPAAVELMDRPILEATRDNLEQARNRAWVQGDPAAILVIEFYRDSEEALEQAADALVADFEDLGFGYGFVRMHGDDARRAWDLRKAGLGLLMGIRGDLKAISFVEDTAVAVKDLPDYIDRIQELLARHGTECVYYAHASVGELHLRPRLNPKDPDDVKKMIAIAEDIADLIRELRGSMSGEHGDGRVRGPLLERVFGAEVTEVQRQVKALFDPKGILNPGKIVDPPPMDADLRFPPGMPVPEVNTVFSFSEDPGLLRAVERCNGAGACRRTEESPGTMCPSYRATLEELHSTRGRANLFRMLLLEGDPAEALRSSELYHAFELCLGCKACKSECPASVDMTRLRSEFLQHYYDAHGTPLVVTLMGQPEEGFGLAQKVAPLSNWWFGSRLGRLVAQRLLGVDPRRRVPPFAPVRFRDEVAGRSTKPGTAGQVVLFIDVFTDLNEPHVGRAALEVLERAGYEVLMPEHAPSGRPQLSKGLVRKARALAEDNVRILAPYAKRGIPIVGIEPSSILTLADEYPELVGESLRDDARTLAASVETIEVFIGRGLRAKAIELPFDGTPRQVLVHGHCHQKALVGVEAVEQALAAIPGAEVEVIPSGCCGMAGSFGYDTRNYDVSIKIGEMVLFPAVRDADRETLIVAAGTSCRQQIADGTGREALHPIEVMYRALRSADEK